MHANQIRRWLGEGPLRVRSHSRDSKVLLSSSHVRGLSREALYEVIQLGSSVEGGSCDF